jgi:acyl-CoA thioester hydrolase
MSEQPPFRYYLKVRYGECDQQGVVYNARYGDFVDLACTEFLRAAFAPQDCFGGDHEFQVVRMLVEWTAPARFDDVLAIDVRLAKLGTTSFTLAFALARAATGEPIATAETVNVHVDGKTWTKKPLADVMRARLTAAARGEVTDHAGWTARRA